MVWRRARHKLRDLKSAAFMSASLLNELKLSLKFFCGVDCKWELKNNMSSCVTEEIADANVFLTGVRGGGEIGYGPPNAVYTVRDIDLHPHLPHTNTPCRRLSQEHRKHPQGLVLVLVTSSNPVIEKQG